MGKTWNPIRGCSRISEGCRHCYAERIAARFSGPGRPYEGLAKSRPEARWTGEVRFVADHLADPLRWREPRRIFVNSMSDLFHEKLTNEQIAAVFGVMAVAPRHTFQLLTKRARRMREWFEWADDNGAASTNALAGTGGAPDAWKTVRGCLLEAAKHIVDFDRHDVGVAWPLPNVWIGVSVENQVAADERIPELLETPAAVHFLSCEPLLGASDVIGRLDPGRCDCEPCRMTSIRCTASRHPIDWVIAGCESGPGARPCDVAWLRSLRDQCAAAGVPFFLKQAIPAHGSLAADAPHPPPIGPGFGAKWKPGLVIELPYLDGVQHKEFPR